MCVLFVCDVLVVRCSLFVVCWYVDCGVFFCCSWFGVCYLLIVVYSSSLFVVVSYLLFLDYCFLFLGYCNVL